MDTSTCYAVYKGYCLICSEEDDGTLHGRIDGIRDIVTFHAATPEALQRAFEEAVDDYLETCARIGKAPQQPASGKMMLRVAPEVHSAALMAAQAAGVSLNQWAARVLGEAARA